MFAQAAGRRSRDENIDPMLMWMFIASVVGSRNVPAPPADEDVLKKLYAKLGIEGVLNVTKAEQLDEALKLAEKKSHVITVDNISSLARDKIDKYDMLKMYLEENYTILYYFLDDITPEYHINDKKNKSIEWMQFGGAQELEKFFIPREAEKVRAAFAEIKKEREEEEATRGKSRFTLDREKRYAEIQQEQTKLLKELNALTSADEQEELRKYTKGMNGSAFHNKLLQSEITDKMLKKAKAASAASLLLPSSNVSAAASAADEDEEKAEEEDEAKAEEEAEEEDEEKAKDKAAVSPARIGESLAIVSNGPPKSGLPDPKKSSLQPFNHGQNNSASTGTANGGSRRGNSIQTLKATYRQLRRFY